MTERKNFITNIVDKTKQFVADIKTREQERIARENEWWEKYTTTPPAEGEPLKKSYQEDIGIMGGFKHIDFEWDSESKKWVNVGQYVESGYGPH
jgi:hypothetical protein